MNQLYVDISWDYTFIKTFDVSFIVKKKWRLSQPYIDKEKLQSRNRKLLMYVLYSMLTSWKTSFWTKFHKNQQTIFEVRTKVYGLLRLRN